MPARRIGQETGMALVRAIVEPAEHSNDSLHCAPELIIRQSSMRPRL
jgi:hypothetical protein